MQDKFTLVKQYILDMELAIISEDTDQEIVVVDDEENGIKNLVIDCEEPIVILEQVILEIPDNKKDLYRRLLQMNRYLVHGAFVIDDEENLILFRDTLQLENLDRNELQGSIQALGMALSEFGSELLDYVAP